MNTALPMETKVWGSVRHAFNSDACGVSVLHTAAGGYCSRHHHVDRVNRFLVVSGKIRVKLYTEQGEPDTSYLLSPGEVLDVPAGTIHRFDVVEPGIVVEVYYPARPGAKVRFNDIHRLDSGGRDV